MVTLSEHSFRPEEDDLRIVPEASKASRVIPPRSLSFWAFFVMVGLGIAGLIIARTQTLVVVPVLSRTLPFGERIDEADLQSRPVSIDDISRHTICEPGRLIGLYSTGMIPSGSPISEDQITTSDLVHGMVVIPISVSRGALETLQIRRGDTVNIVGPFPDPTTPGVFPALVVDMDKSTSTLALALPADMVTKLSSKLSKHEVVLARSPASSDGPKLLGTCGEAGLGN